MSNERAIVHESVADEFESVLRVTARVLANREGFELARPGAAKHLRFLVDEALSGVSLDFSSRRICVTG